MIAASSLFSRLTMGAGKPRGATTPIQTASKPCLPSSASVGVSGSTASRRVPVMASGRSLPARICGNKGATPSSRTSTSPLMTAMVAAGPLYGMCWISMPVADFSCSI